MPIVTPRILPPDSLLAQFAASGDYTDCFTVDVPRAVGLPNFISAFYNSRAFRPERWVLHLIGKGSGAKDVADLAENKTSNFAAWSVIQRTDTEILLQDFQHRTCSWLMVEKLATNAPTIAGRTRLHFGTMVRKPEGLLVRALTPFHIWYAKTLIASAAKNLR